MLEVIGFFLLWGSLSLVVAYCLGFKHGKKALLKIPVGYPGIPDNIDGAPTYDDFQHPKIGGIRLPELF